tara:strand:+ start:5219 stop:5443 length:225 start_codon:yes stop_codon:yes gene_type:complete
MTKSINSRSMRRVKYKLPGGRHKMHRVPRKSCGKSCAITGVAIVAKRLKSRPYGGHLSPRALKNMLIEKARSEE